MGDMISAVVQGRLLKLEAVVLKRLQELLVAKMHDAVVAVGRKMDVAVAQHYFFEQQSTMFDEMSVVAEALGSIVDVAVEKTPLKKVGKAGDMCAVRYCADEMSDVDLKLTLKKDGAGRK